MTEEGSERLASTFAVSWTGLRSLRSELTACIESAMILVYGRHNLQGLIAFDMIFGTATNVTDFFGGECSVAELGFASVPTWRWAPAPGLER